MSSMRYTICFGLCMRKNESLHVAIHMTTENKIEWGNLEYDVRMVFSETTGKTTGHLVNTDSNGSFSGSVLKLSKDKVRNKFYCVTGYFIEH